MIDAVFIVSSLGEVLIEKHYHRVRASEDPQRASLEDAARSPSGLGGKSSLRSLVSDLFWENPRATGSGSCGAGLRADMESDGLAKYEEEEEESREADEEGEDEEEADERSNRPPIVCLAPGVYAVRVQRGDLSYVASVSRQVAPLAIVEFLNRVADVLTAFIGVPNEVRVKDSFSTVYQLLEELVDGGFPLVTEVNTLKRMIAPPTLVNKLAAAVTGASPSTVNTTSAVVSSLPWRNKDVVYHQNEIFVDVVERIDVLIGADGVPLNIDLRGVISVNSRLSGMPVVLLSFEDPDVVGDVSLHRCVQSEKWERERLLCFVPPDGEFELAAYRASPRIVRELTEHASAAPLLPIYCNLIVTTAPELNENGSVNARMEICLGTRHHPARTGERGGVNSMAPVEDVRVRVPLPNARFVDAKSVDGGVSCDDKYIVWTPGVVQPGKPPLRLVATFEASRGFSPSATTCALDFAVLSKPLSGLAVASLQLSNQSYKFFKGVKTVVKAGEVQIRNG